jgi:hypothetical protein
MPHELHAASLVFARRLGFLADARNDIEMEICGVEYDKEF